MDPTTQKLKSTLEPQSTNAGNGAALTLKLDATTTATHMEMIWEWDSDTQTYLKKLKLEMTMDTDMNPKYQLKDTPDTAVKVKTAVMKDLPTSHG